MYVDVWVGQRQFVTWAYWSS